MVHSRFKEDIKSPSTCSKRNLLSILRIRRAITRHCFRGSIRASRSSASIVTIYYRVPSIIKPWEDCTTTTRKEYYLCVYLFFKRAVCIERTTALGETCFVKASGESYLHNSGGSHRLTGKESQESCSSQLRGPPRLLWLFNSTIWRGERTGEWYTLSYLMAWAW